MAAGIVVLKRGATSLERRKNSRQTRAGNVVQCRLPSICEVPTSISGTGCVCGSGNKALTAPCILVQYKKQETNTEKSQKDSQKDYNDPFEHVCLCVHAAMCTFRSQRRMSGIGLCFIPLELSVSEPGLAQWPASPGIPPDSTPTVP